MNATRILWVILVAVALVSPGLVNGQVYVQQGNVLDANPRVNSGGLNTARPGYGSNLGNRIVSGNIGGGASFRGYSPIRDPSSLFFNNYGQSYAYGAGVSGVSNFGLTSYYAQTGLPSDRLTNFNRSSVSIANARAGYIPGSLSRTPYYSPSSTVTSTGAIVAGLNRPGTSQMLSPYSPARPDQRITSNNPLDAAGTTPGSLLSVSSRLVRIDNGQTLSGQLNERLLGSRLFGAVREVSLDNLADRTRQSSGGALLALPEGTPKRTLEERQQENAWMNASRQSGSGLGANQPGLNAEPDVSPGDQPGGRLATTTGDHALAGRGDVYGRMRRTSGDLARTLTPGAESSAVAGRGAGPGPIAAADPSATPVPTDDDLLTPIRTFVGTQATLINARLSEAEELLKQKQYYRAAEAYSAAQVADPSNPLPQLGRAVSLLAAGDYMSSSTALFTAIQLFDSLGRFQIDLNALLPDTAMLESRRADLEKRLQLFDDFRLRFLLGYVQYSTGQPDVGLANLDAAAAQAPAQFADSVNRFVTDLKARRADTSAPATQPAATP